MAASVGGRNGARREGHAREQRGAPWWVVTFALLLAVYQLPQLLARLGIAEPIASAAMLVFYPLALVLARAGRMRLGVAYGLHAGERRWMWLPALFGAAVAAKLVAIALGLASGIYAAQAPPVPMPTPAAWPWLAVVTFVPSLAEDILTRGVWLHSPLARNASLFIVGSAAVYTLNHVWRLALGPAEWVMLFCFGLAYASAFRATGTLWAAVGLHWGWNFAAQAVDALWDVSVVAPVAAKLLSAAVHLGVGAAVVAAARTGRNTIRRNSDTVADRIERGTQP